MRGQNARFGHVITAMVTPFTADDASIDFARAQQLARWLLETVPPVVVG